MGRACPTNITGHFFFHMIIVDAHLSKLPENKKFNTFLGNHFMYCPKVKKLGFG